MENTLQHALDLVRGITIMFIAIDPIGLISIYLTLTEDESLEEKKVTALKSSLAALIVGLLFLFAGGPVFRVLGIEMADFKIGGGLLLVTISIYDMINPGKSKQPNSVSAIVPLGVPLITGPAVLTTLILMNNHYGYLITILSFSINITFVFLSFYFSKWLLHWFGTEGIRGFAKLISILLSAYGVMMIRNGIFDIIGKTVQ